MTVPTAEFEIRFHLAVEPSKVEDKLLELEALISGVLNDDPDVGLYEIEANINEYGDEDTQGT